jgi:hypothetical protein
MPRAAALGLLDPSEIFVNVSADNRDLVLGLARSGQRAPYCELYGGQRNGHAPKEAEHCPKSKG